MKIKLIISVFLIAALLLMPVSFVSSDNPIDYEIRLHEGGLTEVEGYITGGEGSEVAFLVCTEDFGAEDTLAEDIIFVDQQTATLNGTFLFRFIIPEEHRSTDIQVAIGSHLLETAERTLVAVPDFPISLNSVHNNSLRIGDDVYHLSSHFFTSDNAINSLMAGGNVICFKIGDLWYDLLKPAATSSAYLVPGNAIDEEEISLWELNLWYPQSAVSPIEFEPIILN